VTYHPSWRLPDWDADVPSRPGWAVTCPEHGPLGNPPGWAYAASGSAYTVATRHVQRWHLGIVNHRRRAARKYLP
jgi:hypothetical protein